MSRAVTLHLSPFPNFSPHSTQLGWLGCYPPRHYLHWGGCVTSLVHPVTMVYDWDGKREICYQMYIKDKKALEEIMEYMKNVYQFAPRSVILRTRHQ